MKRIISFLFIIFFFNASNAQLSVGVSTGCSYNHLNTDISNRMLTNNVNKAGYSLGLQMKYDVNALLSLQTGFNVLQKNYSINRTGDYIGIYEEFVNSYFQTPINIQFKIFEIKKMSFVINTGVYGAYWYLSNIKGSIPNIFNSTETIGNGGEIIQNLTTTNFSEKYKFNSIIDNRFEYGFDAGLGLYYKVNNSYSLFLDFNYYQSLTDLQKKYMINQISKSNQTLCISIGYLMRFSTN